jgi:hypothetical protein
LIVSRIYHESLDSTIVGGAVPLSAPLTPTAIYSFVRGIDTDFLSGGSSRKVRHRFAINAAVAAFAALPFIATSTVVFTHG